MRISDWSSDVCSSDLQRLAEGDDPRLGRGVVGLARIAGDADHRGDVDDAALARLHHAAHHRLAAAVDAGEVGVEDRSEEHTSELQSLMRISYAVFCLKKKNHT